LQNPNSTDVNVILQNSNVISPLGGQTSVTIPAGALYVYSTGAAGIPPGASFAAFASLPIRMLGLRIQIGPVGAASLIPVAVGGAGAPVQRIVAMPGSLSFHWKVGAANPPAPMKVSLGGIFNENFPFAVKAPGGPFSINISPDRPPQTLSATLTVTAD